MSKRGYEVGVINLIPCIHTYSNPQNIMEFLNINIPTGRQIGEAFKKANSKEVEKCLQILEETKIEKVVSQNIDLSDIDDVLETYFPYREQKI